MIIEYVAVSRTSKWDPHARVRVNGEHFCSLSAPVSGRPYMTCISFLFQGKSVVIDVFDTNANETIATLAAMANR